MNEKNWAMILHLSLLLNYVVPLGGIIAPIVIWQLKKNDMPGIDAHGKVVVNWIISALIYAIVCIPLFFIVIGVPLLMLLGVLSVAFPIVGAIKASNGELWKYPLSIPFFN
jgi:uncharacterized protein